MQPGSKAAFTTERRQPLPDPHEHILHQLFCQYAVCAQAQAKRKYPPGVGVVKGGEGGLVALLCRQHRGVDHDLAGGQPRFKWYRYV